MRTCLSLMSSRRGALILACLALPLTFAPPSRAEVAQPFKITSFVLKQDGTAALQWEGPNTNIVVEFAADYANPVWQPVPGVEWPVSGNNWTGLMPKTGGTGFLRVTTKGGPSTTPIPMKTISLVQITWHNPEGDKFMRNCISCHGTRTKELALDGTTKKAHSTMLGFFGGGNDRCISCHYNGPKFTGPDFLTHSAGALRKQVNYEVNNCTSCHGKGTDNSLYDRN